MATTTVRTPIERVELPGEKRATPVLWWAGLGAAFAALAVFVFGAWILGGDAQAVVAHDVPTSTKVWAWINQGVTVSLTVGVAIYLYRSCRRAGHLTFDALLCLAVLSLYWQDPMVNIIRPNYFWNSYMVNLGSWAPHIPGWLSPDAQRLPDPLLLAGPGYFWTTLPVVIGVSAWMRWCKRRWPAIGTVGLVFLAWGAAFTCDLLLELPWIRTGMLAYPGAIQELSIWGGKTYQFPIYEAAIWGMVWAMLGALRYFRDDRGLTFVERGIERVHVSERKRTGLRLLAFVGLINLATMGYNVVFVFLSLHADPAPAGYPSYLVNGLCGEGTDRDCVDPRAPIVIEGNITDQRQPFTGRN